MTAPTDSQPDDGIGRLIDDNPDDPCLDQPRLQDRLRERARRLGGARRLSVPVDAAVRAAWCWWVATAVAARRDRRGQGTVEYALILLGAAAVALVVVAWVTRTDLIGRLFDTVVGRILDQAS